jgi:hypothetical protein
MFARFLSHRNEAMGRKSEKLQTFDPESSAFTDARHCSAAPIALFEVEASKK